MTDRLSDLKAQANQGVLPSQAIRAMIAAGEITADGAPEVRGEPSACCATGRSGDAEELGGNAPDHVSRCPVP